MSQDEKDIRDLIARWHSATAAKDVETVLGLIAEDAVFLVAGQPPMRGRSAFEKGLRSVLATHRIESSGEVQEVEVSGNLAYSWTKLTVRVVPQSGGDAVVRTGNAISVLHKKPDGAWVLVRDANMLSVAK
jgi:uncharacterized protein (TIGR02246 family)